MSAASNPSYRKVRGGGFTWKGRGQLWLAPDFLLEVNSIFITETYRRFFFQDIRAFVIQRTNVRRIWGWIFGVVGLIAGVVTGSLLTTALVNHTEDFSTALYIPAGFFGVAFLFCLVMWILNLTFGPSCNCQVLTQAGWRALSAPRRLGPALRVQAEIVGMTHAVQGLPPSTTPPPVPAATS
jgi:hypothetical protein